MIRRRRTDAELLAELEVRLRRLRERIAPRNRRGDGAARVEQVAEVGDARSRRPRGVPPPPEIHPRLDWKEVKRLFVTEGLGPTEIARRTGYTYVCVNKALRDQGLRRPPPLTRTGKWARKIYRLWKRVRSRCLNPADAEYASYGGRGIGIDPRWCSFRPFYEWARANGYRPGLYLALVDPYRDVSSRNCRFVTPKEFVRSRFAEGIRSAARIEAFGERKPVSEWTRDRRCRVSGTCLRARLRTGMLPVEALTATRAQAAKASLLSRPVLAKGRTGIARGTDWAAVEREWLRDRTDFGELARRLGVRRATVLHRLGAAQARIRAQRRIVPARTRELLYRKWREMFEKCRNPEHKQHYRIGARGIDVCRSWQSFDSFCRWAVEAGYEPGLWLARKLKGRDYSPSNCTWLEERDARRQTRSDSKPPRIRWPITAFGETRSPLAWASDRRCVVCYQTLLRRLHAGWSAEKALTSQPRVQVGGPPSTAIQAFGQMKSLAEWARDRRCKVRSATLRARLLRGIEPEAAIATPGYRLVP